MAVNVPTPPPTIHARTQWARRAESRLTLREAWVEGDPVPRVAEKLGQPIRYHAPTDTLLVADEDNVVTVYEREDDRRADIWEMVDHYGGER